MKWIKERLSEPSSWSALAATVGVWAPAFPSYETAIYIIAGICATVGFAMKETGNHAADE